MNAHELFSMWEFPKKNRRDISIFLSISKWNCNGQSSVFDQKWSFLHMKRHDFRISLSQKMLLVVFPFPIMIAKYFCLIFSILN